MIDASSHRLMVWLRQLARLKPAPWHWPRAVRAAISVGLPFAVGLTLNDIMTGMWIAMGTLLMTTGEQAGPYATVLRRLTIAAPMGAAGYLAGYLTGLPWAGTVAAMAALAFGAGLVSSYSAALSIGCLQFLLTAAIAIGVPSVAPFWEPALLYLVGAVFYAALLCVEAGFVHQRPRQDRLATLLAALADLADAKAQDQPIAAARRAVTDGLAALDAALLPHSRAAGNLRRFALARQQSDAVFTALLATRDDEALRAAARQLRLMAAAAATTKAVRSNPILDGPLAVPLRSLADVLAGRAPDAQPSAASRDPVTPDDVPRPRFVMPDREALMSALALALCMALAYASHWINPATHWFWVPLTVGLVMKPDLGSIFARALLRSIGTLAGVLLGAVILIVMPKNLGFALIMAALAGILPWAMQRSYALQAIVLTPLVLMLVDVIVPGTGDANYAVQRLSDTLIGGAIVMVFGYWLWPKRRTRYFARAFGDCRQAVASYLLSVLSLTPNERVASTSQARGQAYARLAALGAQFDQALADPPPANAEAAIWLPRLAGLERICDAISAYAATPGRSKPQSPEPLLTELARVLKDGSPVQPPGSALELLIGSPEHRLAVGLLRELESMQVSVTAGAAQQPACSPSPGGRI
ncbi:MAG: FUSC family protein [Pigmentiphaga sp.]